MSSTYTYKLRLTAWGVWIRITADARVGEDVGSGAVPLGDGVFLVDATDGAALGPGKMGMLATGLRRLTPEIAASVSERPVTIAVKEIRYNDCDYQEEGLVAAVIGWAVAEFGLPEREVPATFDKDNNRYVYELPELDGR